MYWWNIEALRGELADGTHKESSRFAYLLAYVLLSTLAVELPGEPESRNFWDNAHTIGYLLITAIGTWWAYRQNGGAQGQRFVERYLAIGWVLCWRLGALFVPLVLLVYFISGLNGTPSTESGPFDVAWGLLFGLVFYERLGFHTRLVASVEAGSTAA